MDSTMKASAQFKNIYKQITHLPLCPKVTRCSRMNKMCKYNALQVTAHFRL